ncbi:hypothetical protein FSARC_8173 [Fusarium sarcochroum]|uniref:Uncharacterized protein n=1 Tax=Fusarium sarcochroum TaxID=1208366 RepID=A0A8H4X6L5_9HYPO|nr:hypothetical protein FSARC_8173 [Fusarium sarcochroum]
MLSRADKAAVEKEVSDFVDSVFASKEADDSTEDSSDDSSNTSPNDTMVKGASKNTQQSTPTDQQSAIHPPPYSCKHRTICDIDDDLVPSASLSGKLYVYGTYKTTRPDQYWVCPGQMDLPPPHCPFSGYSAVFDNRGRLIKPCSLVDNQTDINPPTLASPDNSHALGPMAWINNGRTKSAGKRTKKVN